MAEPTETPRRNLTGAVIPALAAAGLAAVGAIFLVGVTGLNNREAAAPRDCIVEGAEGLGGPIDLIDHNGARVTQADFAGQPAVVYFGFTHCPAICPSTMLVVGEALEQPGGHDVQPILISVDPARDTPERLRRYVATEGFPLGLVGLTGSQAQIDAALGEFHAYGRAQPPAPGAAADDYNVDHTSILYVMDGRWRAVSAIQTVRREDPMDPTSAMLPVAPEEIAACIAAGLERSVTGT